MEHNQNTSNKLIAACSDKDYRIKRSKNEIKERKQKPEAKVSRDHALPDLKKFSHPFKATGDQGAAADVHRRGQIVAAIISIRLTGPAWQGYFHTKTC